MSDLFVSWTEYHQLVERLAVEVYESGWRFDRILCVARGGLRVGDILSRLFDCPLAILATSSYGGAEGRQRGQVSIAPHLTMSSAPLGRRILVVDDLVDSGESLKAVLEWLRDRYGDDIEEIRTAVLWYKACGNIAPDYYVEYLQDNPWIHQPFEEYEKMNPTSLAARKKGDRSAP
ncbi:phosphoribosyltransferase [Baaleninema sp.]|uniref:phosphoribosyltransferase n=1 Tax=Baaleninema sp. TaxID=3101197 RepID=UPI003D0835C3